LQINQRLLIFLLGDSIPRFREGHEVHRRLFRLPFGLVRVDIDRHQARQRDLNPVDRRGFPGEVLIEQIQFPRRPARDLGRPRAEKQRESGEPTKPGVVG
jgi:hypothetical protein